MNRRIVVITVAVAALAVFAAGGFFYNRVILGSPTAAIEESNSLVRPHSPIIGPSDAPVTIVEFFDPSCEACRAFYPIVKQIMSEHPTNLRLVLRYAPFHDGSEEAVRILETARLQSLFLPVLEALIAQQPEWAPHAGPQLDKAWAAAASAGLDVPEAKAAMFNASINAALTQDIADGKKFDVLQTPTFFVNGKPLPIFGAQQLADLVNAEIAASN